MRLRGLCAATGLLLASFGVAAGAPPAIPTVVVDVTYFTYVPGDANRPTTNLTIDQGSPLAMSVLDTTQHTLTADDSGPDGPPLFDTGIVNNPGVAFVRGVELLAPGEYRFHCSFHDFMLGILHVVAAPLA